MRVLAALDLGDLIPPRTPEGVVFSRIFSVSIPVWSGLATNPSNRAFLVRAK